jgi:hypothetical protein
MLKLHSFLSTRTPRSVITTKTAETDDSFDKAYAEAYEDEPDFFNLCPNTSGVCGGSKAKEIVVDKWVQMTHTKSTDGFASIESKDLRQTFSDESFAADEDDEVLSDTSSMIRQPKPPQDYDHSVDQATLPKDLCFYRRKRDWDLPRKVNITWIRESNVKHFFGIHKWLGQLSTKADSDKKVVVGTIVCYELQPLAAIRKSGHGAVLLKSIDAYLYKLSLLAGSTQLQSETLWSDHWENLPLMLISNVYVPPHFRGRGLGLALVDDACRKPGRDIPWILTATNDESLVRYFGLLGFAGGVFGPDFGARWNDCKRMPRIADVCPHFPTAGASIVTDDEEEMTLETPPVGTKMNVIPSTTEAPFGLSNNDEDEEGSESSLRITEEVTLSNFTNFFPSSRIGQNMRTKARILRQRRRR